MGYPNNKCMVLTIYIHHMLVDELFDFLNDRIDTPPAYWFSEADAPYSISGGYIIFAYLENDLSFSFCVFLNSLIKL